MKAGVLMWQREKDSACPAGQAASGCDMPPAYRQAPSGSNPSRKCKSSPTVGRAAFPMAAGEGFDLPCGAGRLGLRYAPGISPRALGFESFLKMQKQPDRWSGCFPLAAGEGFEPSHTESESAVLPLHNPAVSVGANGIIPNTRGKSSFFSFRFAGLML